MTSTSRRQQRSALGGLALIAAVAAPAATRAQIAFDDVTASAGITHVGPSWGAGWGDFDGDGRPDLYAGNHMVWPQSLYRNLPGGQFQDIASSVIVGRIPGDRHGPAWADFDNDGDQDLVVLEGNSLGTDDAPNQFFENRNGQLVDEAVGRGVAYPEVHPFSGVKGATTPAWLDFDNDGRLDMIQASSRTDTGPTALFAQRNGLFENVSAQAGFSILDLNRLVQITGFGSIGPPLVLVHGMFFPDHVYRYDVQPFQDVTAALGLLPRRGEVQDVAVADFDGDLVPDLYLTQRHTPSDLLQPDALRVRANLQTNADEKGLSFRSDADVTLRIGPPNYISLQNVFIGAAGAHPPSNSFTLSVTDAAHVGMVSHQPGIDYGLYIGRDPVQPVWRILLSKPGWIGLNLEIDGTQPITSVASIGFAPSDGAQPDAFLRRTAQGFVDVSAAAGLATPTACDSVAAGDLDDDMDVDVFLVCNRGAGNEPDILLENLGNGSFARVPLAGGAEGSDRGRGDSVAVADYDGDGFLDLFVMNGAGNPYFNSDGPDQLFHNRGNANHWIEIDLEGVVSNRDGVGARVLVAAGGKAQVREQNGGIHRYSQDHQRLHFGLGPNAVVGGLRIEWPSGAIQQLAGIPANQVIRVVEPSAPSLDGTPSYQAGVDAGTYLWRDAATGIFHVRASGDGIASTFSVRLLSSAPIQILGAPGLEPGDGLTGSPNAFALTAQVAADEDGVDFRLAAGAFALIAVQRDGTPNPRLLHVGASGKPLAPSGWIRELDALPAPPSFQAGSDLGLFVGRAPATNTIIARWSGNGVQHAMRASLLSSKPFTGVTPVGLETGDTISGGAFAVTAAGAVAADADGVDVTAQPGTRIGITWLQDGLFQAQRANPTTRDLGPPDAYSFRSP